MEYITLFNINKISKFEDIKSSFIFTMFYFLVSNTVFILTMNQYIGIAVYIATVIGALTLFIEKSCCQRKPAGMYFGSFCMTLTPLISLILDLIIDKCQHCAYAETKYNLLLLLVAVFSGIMLDIKIFNEKYISPSRSFLFGSVIYFVASNTLHQFVPIAIVWPVQTIFMGGLIGLICLIIYVFFNDENYVIQKKKE